MSGVLNDMALLFITLISRLFHGLNIFYHHSRITIRSFSGNRFSHEMHIAYTVNATVEQWHLYIALATVNFYHRHRGTTVVKIPVNTYGMPFIIFDSKLFTVKSQTIHAFMSRHGIGWVKPAVIQHQ